MKKNTKFYKISTSFLYYMAEGFILYARGFNISDQRLFNNNARN